MDRMKWTGLAAAALAVLVYTAAMVVPHTVMARDTTSVGPIDAVRLFTAEPITVGGTATSVAYGEFASSKNQVIAYRGVGTSPNFKVEALCSLDGVNYVVPAQGGTISAATTDQNWHISAMFTPLPRGVKIKITELSGANTVAADVIIGCQ